MLPQQKQLNKYHHHFLLFHFLLLFLVTLQHKGFVFYATTHYKILQVFYGGMYLTGILLFIYIYIILLLLWYFSYFLLIVLMLQIILIYILSYNNISGENDQSTLTHGLNTILYLSITWVFLFYATIYLMPCSSFKIRILQKII